MKNNFTTSCFIRKNTKEIREKLEILGIVSLDTCDSDKIIYTASIGDIYYFSTTNYPSIKLKLIMKEGHIDCGINEELFFALAALRDDTDINQWFTDGENWVFSDIHDLMSLNDYFKEIGFNYSKTHKATTDEIVEHFKI